MHLSSADPHALDTLRVMQHLGILTSQHPPEGLPLIHSRRLPKTSVVIANMLHRRTSFLEKFLGINGYDAQTGTLSSEERVSLICGKACTNVEQMIFIALVPLDDLNYHLHLVCCGDRREGSTQWSEMVPPQLKWWWAMPVTCDRHCDACHTCVTQQKLRH
ncbi:hypothetical protein B0H34DRAFT_807573 [Crassisporium funariophilum]|nr:hypothetical protein B0H34DRAFT_807573 [Crassisporium funariophilum]